MKKSIFFAAVMMFVLSAVPAQAKWWIFGKGKKDGVTISYLYLNNMPYQDMNGKAVFYSDSMQKNEIVVAGKAKTSNGSVGTVMVSLDGKETWEKANLAKDGTFEYVFTPEKGRTYDFYLKAVDTTGKNNEVDETAVKISLSDEKIKDKIIPFLTALFNAYQDKNRKEFMDMVSDSFAGGKEILDTAITSDFTLLEQIRFLWSVNSITAAPGGRISISLRYERRVTVADSGTPLSDKGFTEIHLEPEEGELKLAGMKSPLLFGLSGEEDIAGGTIQQPASEGGTLVIEGRTVRINSNRESGTITLCAGHICDGFGDWGYDFDMQTFTNSDGSMAAYKGTGLHLNSISGFLQLQSACDIDTVAVPASGYSLPTDAISVASPECWALDYGARGKVIFKVTSGDTSTTNPITLHYVYER
jgi:hypothetical protein